MRKPLTVSLKLHANILTFFAFFRHAPLWIIAGRKWQWCSCGTETPVCIWVVMCLDGNISLIDGCFDRKCSWDSITIHYQYCLEERKADMCSLDTAVADPCNCSWSSTAMATWHCFLSLRSSCRWWKNNAMESVPWTIGIMHPYILVASKIRSGSIRDHSCTQNMIWNWSCSALIRISPTSPVINTMQLE